MAKDPSEEVTPLLINSGPVQAAYPTTGYPDNNNNSNINSNAYTPYPPPSAYSPNSYPPPTNPYAPPPPHGYAPNSYAPNPAYPPQPGYNPAYPPNTPFGAAPPPSALPPNFNPSPVPNAQGNIEVPCRVCAQTISYSAARKFSAVKCTHCNHATQVGPPPQGKTYILCQCNTLLTVPLTAKAATCPKVDCKRTLILAPEAPGKQRAFCAHCNTLLTYRTASAAVICPKCRGRSIVNRSRLQWYISFNIIFGLLCIALGLFFTLGSYEAAGNGGIYFVFWGLCLGGVLALVRAGIYWSLNWRARDAVYVPV